MSLLLLRQQVGVFLSSNHLIEGSRVNKVVAGGTGHEGPPPCCSADLIWKRRVQHSKTPYRDDIIPAKAPPKGHTQFITFPLWPNAALEVFTTAFFYEGWSHTQTHRGDEVRRSPLGRVSSHRGRRGLISNGEAAPQKAHNRVSARTSLTIIAFMLVIIEKNKGSGHDIQNKL